MLPASSLSTVSQTLGLARTHPIPAARKDSRPANRLPTVEAMQFYLFESALHPKTGGEIGQLPIRGKQCQGHGWSRFSSKISIITTPAFASAVINLSKVR